MQIARQPLPLHRRGCIRRYGGHGRTYGSPGNNVSLTDFDARNQAGQYEGMDAFNDHPAVRTEYHSAPIGASNGSHSTRGSVTSNAGKVESKLDIMKRTQRVISE